MGWSWLKRGWITIAAITLIVSLADAAGMQQVACAAGSGGGLTTNELSWLYTEIAKVVQKNPGLSNDALLGKAKLLLNRLSNMEGVSNAAKTAANFEEKGEPILEAGIETIKAGASSWSKILARGGEMLSVDGLVMPLVEKELEMELSPGKVKQLASVNSACGGMAKETLLLNIVKIKLDDIKDPKCRSAVAAYYGPDPALMADKQPSAPLPPAPGQPLQYTPFQGVPGQNGDAAGAAVGS